MANIVKREAGGQLTPEAFAKKSTAFKRAAPKAGGPPPYLRVTEDGWEMGSEGISIPEDSLWAVFPTSFASGYVAWKGRKPIAKRMAAYDADPIDPTALPPVDCKGGWEPNVGFVLVCVEANRAPEIVGNVGIFENRSQGAIEAWTHVYDAVVARAEAGLADFAPLVKLTSSSYEHAEWGTVVKPVFRIEGWDDPNGLVDDFGPPLSLARGGATDDDDDDTAPVDRRASRARSDAGGVEDADIIEDKPATTRRRRRAEPE